LRPDAVVLPIEGVQPIPEACKVSYFLFIVPITGIGQKHYDFNTTCRQAYQSIIELRLEDGANCWKLKRKGSQ